jgi:hypothetical protein
MPAHSPRERLLPGDPDAHFGERTWQHPVG